MKGLKTGGRTAGTPNKVAGEKKEILSNFVDSKLHELDELYERVKKDNPIAAYKLVMDALEFVLPKLKSVDNSFGNSDVTINVTYKKNDSQP